MKSYESLNHTKWECKYHVVFIPKYRRNALYGELRQHLGEVFHDLAKQRESKIEQGNLVIDRLPLGCRIRLTPIDQDTPALPKKFVGAVSDRDGGLPTLPRCEVALNRRRRRLPQNVRDASYKTTFWAKLP